MVKRILIICAWLGVFCLAAFLRLDDLEQRPIHADEATGARILAERLEKQAYTFDPHHFHGPLLSLTTKPIAQLVGESSWTELSKRTLRLGPAIAGLLIVLCPLLWRRQLGSIGSLTAAALLATSPLLVYYNQMYIHESLLTLFAMLALPLVYKLFKEPTIRTALLAGAFIGLMFTTKETFAISVLSWVSAVIVCYVSQLLKIHSTEVAHKVPMYIVPTVILIVTFSIVSGFIYSNGFRSASGVIDAVNTYFVYETTDGHNKAFSYYVELLIWPKHAIGIYWSEALIAALSVASCIFVFRARTNRCAILFVFCATIAHFIIYSYISYKTPWLMLVPWAHACLLASFCIKPLMNYGRGPTAIVTCILLLGLGYQTKQCLHATGRYSSDARNPYAYVPTSKDTEALSSWLRDLKNQPGGASLGPIAVIGNGYWPLPWYLKEFDTIGYWPEVSATVDNYSMIFAMPDQDPATKDLLSNSHVALPRSLRAEVPVVLYLRNDIWNQWITQPQDD